MRKTKFLMISIWFLLFTHQPKHKLKPTGAIFELQIFIFIINQLVQRNGAGNRVLSNNKFVPGATSENAVPSCTVVDLKSEKK